MQFRAELVSVERTLDQLRAVDRKVRKKVLRKATRAATSILQKEARRIAPRVNGFFRMSLKIVVKVSKKGVAYGQVGQEKGKQFKRKRFKGSNINRKGFAAPIWWIEQGTKAHAITAEKVLVWTTGKRKGSKGQARFARNVKHPGMQPRRVLENAARLAGSRAAAQWNQVCADELAKVPSPGASQ